MTAFEILTLIGEFVFTEIDGVTDIEYEKVKTGEPVLFTMQMENGKEYIVEIKEKLA